MKTRGAQVAVIYLCTHPQTKLTSENFQTRLVVFRFLDHQHDWRTLFFSSSIQRKCFPNACTCRARSASKLLFIRPIILTGHARAVGAIAGMETEHS